jgi:hypothetical protein
MDKFMELTLEPGPRTRSPGPDLLPTQEVFFEPKMLAPVELVTIPYLIYRLEETMDNSQLLEAIYLLRQDVAKKFGPNTSINSRVVKHIVAFIE